MKNFHSFHMVEMSPWPIFTACAVLCLTLSLVNWFHFHTILELMFSSLFLLMMASFWWMDVIREGTFQGYHTKKVVEGLKMGMILFILSEIMFFFSFFWMFFHSALVPSIEIGMMWPPLGVNPFNPLELPLLNTSILLASGVSLTWAHYCLLNSKRQEGVFAMIWTILLGLVFTLCQAFEYYFASFTISSSIYGSAFFMMTGFHGVHVILGSIFLLVTTYRFFNSHFSYLHHVGFEMSAWYWHFVDIVWLFLYTVIYWWGS